MLRRLINWFDFNFMPRDYVVVEIDGSGCTMTPVDAASCVSSLDDDQVVGITPCRMTARAFYDMDEFYGW
jgi:hypothetical protein